MVRLIVVRHAKSAWDDPSLADIDRPLAERGIEAAAWIGDMLADQDLRADRVLCSPARRTRETLELALGRVPAKLRPADIVFSDAVYEQRDEDYVDLIRSQVDADTLMIVGHNPATEETAALLTGSAIQVRDLEALMERFPTGAVAVINFIEDDWAQIERSGGELWAFLRPPKP